MQKDGRAWQEKQWEDRDRQSLYCLVTHRKVKILKEEYLNTTQQVHLCDRICNRITEYKRPHKRKSENKKNKKYHIHKIHQKFTLPMYGCH